MAHGDNVDRVRDRSVWRAGTLSIADLERLAGEIRPSWEIGLDVASADAAMFTTATFLMAPPAGAFVAAPPALAAEMVGLLSVPASPTVPAQATSMAPSAVPASTSPSRSGRPAKVSVPPARSALPANAEPAVSVVAPASRHYASPGADLRLPRHRPRLGLFGLISGGVFIVVGALYLAFRGAAPDPAAPPGGPATEGVTAASRNEPSPRAAATPATLPAVPASGAVAPAQPRYAPTSAVHPTASSSVATGTAGLPSVPTPTTTRRATPPGMRSHSTTSRPHGAGFVTDSPY
jgi:hypothetical protein